MITPKIPSDIIYQSLSGIGSPGVCLSCGYFDEYAGCEPDAQNYTCPICNEDQLFGLELAIVMEAIDIIDEE